MDLLDRIRHRARREQSGVAALEFALVLPLLLVFILGIVSVGHGLVVRYVLSSAAYDAARTCALNRTVTPACASAIINNRLQGAGGAGWCAGLAVNVSDALQPGFQTVNTAVVTADCGYRGIIATGYLQAQGFALFNVRARATMPH